MNPNDWFKMENPHHDPKMNLDFQPLQSVMDDSSFYGGSNVATMDECSSGFQSASISNLPSSFPSTLPSSASTTIGEYPPQLPPSCFSATPQLGETPSDVIRELGIYISKEQGDHMVLGSSLGLLFRFSFNLEFCQLMSGSSVILNSLYDLLTNEKFKEHDPILFLATGNWTNMSKCEAGRSAILGCNGLQTNEWPSRGVLSLMSSLQSPDSNVVIFAITAVHNLLLDRRMEVQEIAKKQIKHADGIKHIVKQLANQSLANNYEFKVVVLDCLQILAYGNMENRLTILESGGPKLLLNAMKENFDNQPEELIETASRVLKSLSACPNNKIDIIKYDGIAILTQCIRKDNQEILKTCLWTLRNLSDVINNSEREQSSHVEHLVDRLLRILRDYSTEPCIITCALGILANLTCNNEPIKQFICDLSGVEIILKTIEIALRGSGEYVVLNNEILEPAVCTLCHLLNQSYCPQLSFERQIVKDRFMNYPAFKTLRRACTSDELSKALHKLDISLGVLER